jgi:hypothetical protein
MSDIDWSNPESQISHWFSVKEALWLPTWNRMADENDGLDDNIKNNLTTLFAQMDHVREFFACPIVVHCAFRPAAYNQLVGGAKSSPHMEGMAVDFHVSEFNDGPGCDKVRELLEPSLEALQMRMEKNPGGNWVHLDRREPGPGGRFFKP